MTNYDLFSDGACDLGLARSEALNITLIPFYVSLDQETYAKELFELSLETFYDAMTTQNVFPKTSLPSVADYIDAFRPSLEAGRGIICTTITLSLSGSYQSATTAKDMLMEEFPDAQIHIINSFQATMCEGMMVAEMAKMKQAGKTIDEVVAYAEESKKTSRIFFTVNNLKHLEAGGRVGKVAALSGNLLKIQPLIVLQDGELEVAGMARGRTKSLNKVLDLAKTYFQESGENPADYAAVVATTTAWSDMPEFTEKCKELLPQIQEAAEIGATIGAHTGPGTIGLCIVKRWNA